MDKLMPRLFVLALIASVLLGCQISAPSRLGQPADVAPGEVAFELAGPGGAAIVVPVTINGQGPFNFVVDTGATLVCVDQDLARKLNLPERRGQVGVGATVTSTGQIQLVGVDSLQVGTATGKDMLACRIDMQNVQALGTDIKGLLGLSFLKSFRVTIDFTRKTLTLQKP